MTREINVLEIAIGVMVSLIVIFSVVIPIIKDAINTAALAGTEAIIANLIILFVTLGGLTAVIYWLYVAGYIAER